jgi:hypothetical protein
MSLHAEHAPRPVTLAWLDAEEAIIVRWPGIEGPPGDPVPERSARTCRPAIARRATSGMTHGCGQAVAASRTTAWITGASSSWRRFSTAWPPGSHPTTTSCCLARARCASGLPPSSGRAIPGRGARDRLILGPPAG